MGKFWIAAVVAVLAWGFAMHTMASASQSVPAFDWNSKSATAAGAGNHAATPSAGR